LEAWSRYLGSETQGAVWKSTWPGLVAPLLRSPDLGYVPIAFRGVCDRACAIAEAAIKEGHLDVLAVLVHFDHVGLEEET
jgi:hypothetical protein